MARPRKRDPESPAADRTPSVAGADIDARRRAHDARELACDRLVELVGAEAHDGLDPADPAMDRYWEWLAHEARAALAPAERQLLQREAEAFAGGMLARLAAMEAMPGAAARSPRLVRGVPDARPAPPSGVGLAAVRAAAAVRHAPRLDLAVAAGQGRDLWEEPATAWVKVPDDVPGGQHVALQVHGDSMEPMLHAGDTILVRLGEDVTVGDVIVARRPEDGYVVKRVASRAPGRLVLSSFNVAYADVEVPTDGRHVVGTVVLRWCAHAVGTHSSTAARAATAC